jgi:hypothetical protein
MGKPKLNDQIKLIRVFLYPEMNGIYNSVTYARILNTYHYHQGISTNNNYKDVQKNKRLELKSYLQHIKDKEKKEEYKKDDCTSIIYL